MADEQIIVHVDASKKRDDLPEYDDGKCPRCGGETEIGFGLAGGGFGVYSFCPKCQIVTSKTEVED